ncbi:MAG: lcfB11 [Frankiales bacterium]|nr:lcfB11 [Frankiales bacterium]
MSIAILLDLAVGGTPERLAVGRKADGLTFEALEQRVVAAAALLRDADAGSVAFVGMSGPAFHVALFAAAHAGLAITPLNYRLATDQLLELLDELDRPVIIADPVYLRLLHGRPKLISTEDLLLAPYPADPLPADDVDEDSPAVVLFTSGTTSKPKGVILRHSHLVNYVLGTVDPGSAAEEDAALVSVPPYHVAGVGTVLTNTTAGRRVVHLPDFTAEEWLATVRGEGVTSAMVVPTMLARIVEHLGDDLAEAPSLQSIAYGGARITLPALQKALKAFPETGFVNAYGLTETSSTIALLGPEDHREAMTSDDPKIQRRLASAGKFVPNLEYQIRGLEGELLPAGEVGELWVRGPQVSGEYLGKGSVTDAEGWFPTKDRASVDEDGYLFIEGRSDDTIIRGGENIAPAEVEDVLILHTAVRDVAVIGVPDEEWGERLVAVIVRESGHEPSVDELRAFVRERLRGSRTPDDVVFRDELPVTPTGKLLRRTLVAELSDPT